MKGNCKHRAYRCNNVEERVDGRFVSTPIQGSVCLENDDDPHYHQIFETADELDAFIRELIETRRKAFDVRSAWHFEP